MFKGGFRVITRRKNGQISRIVPSVNDLSNVKREERPLTDPTCQEDLLLRGLGSNDFLKLFHKRR